MKVPDFFRTAILFGLLAAVLSLFGTTASAVGVKPKLMVIMQEKVMGVFGTTGFEQPNQAEISLMDHFDRLGYMVVDPATVRRNITQAKGLRLLEGDDKAAAAVGLQHGAHYSIIGKAYSKPAGAKLYGTELQSIHATLTARLIRNSDARVIAAASADAAHAHRDEVRGGVLAIEEAAELLAAELSAKIPVTDRPGAARAGTELAVNISGLVSYRHLDFVMGFLERQVAGVRGLALHGFSSGSAELTMGYAGQAADLAGALSRHSFKGFRLEPTHVTPNRIDIRAVLNRR